MPETTVDLLIVGQGVAGSALAWQAIRRGLQVHVIGSPPEWPASASKVGAGLITPITGSRLALSWRFNDFRASAFEFYQFVTNQTNISCWVNRPAIRWLTPSEEALWQSRCQKFPSIAPYLQAIQREQVISPGQLPDGPHNSKPYMMPDAARVLLPAFLEATSCWLSSRSLITHAEFTPRELVWDEAATSWRWRHIAARRVVLSTGYSPYLVHLPFLPAKGELIEIELPGMPQTYSWHGGLWMTPQSSDRWLVGATYDPLHLNHETTSKARDELCQGLEAWGILHPRICSQQAAIRPAVPGQLPVVGWGSPGSIFKWTTNIDLPDKQICGLMNGLGSRGALWAPLLANWLLDSLTGQPIPQEVDLARFLKSMGLP